MLTKFSPIFLAYGKYLYGIAFVFFLVLYGAFASGWEKSEFIDKEKRLSFPVDKIVVDCPLKWILFVLFCGFFKASWTLLSESIGFIAFNAKELTGCRGTLGVTLMAGCSILVIDSVDREECPRCNSIESTGVFAFE